MISGWTFHEKGYKVMPTWQNVDAVKYWDGTEWKGTTVKYWDGIEWKELYNFSFIAMSWIDESSPYRASLATYNSDKEYYLVAREKSVKYKDGCYVPGRSTSGIKHSSGSFPTGMIVSQIGRPPGGNALINNFETLLANFQASEVLPAIQYPKTLILAVDNSGSMTTATIQPAYNNLKNHVNANYPDIEIKEYEYGNERWLYLFGNAVLDAIATNIKVYK